MFKRSVFTAATLPAICLAAPAYAQSEAAQDTDDDAIVVLGTRQTSADRTLSSDVVTEIMSQSSRSVERDVLTAIGADRLSDALELISGVSNQNNRGGVMDNFAIRGFLGTPDGGAEYYVDGFLANRGLAPPRDPATAERIELLKGPAGALYGDIDPGGRVNIVTKTPKFTPEAHAVFSYGSFDTRRLELDATAPITEHLAARIVYAKEKSDGWRDYVTLDRQVISPSLTWRIGNSARITYIGEFTRFDTPFDRGIPAIDGDANALPASNYYGEPGDGPTRFRNERHQLTGEVQLGDNWALNGGIAYRTGTLRGKSSDQSSLKPDGQLWRQRRIRDYWVDDLSARMELTGKLGAHRVSLGMKGYWLDYHEGLERKNPSAQNPYALDIFNPVYGATPPTTAPFTDNQETRYAGTLYLQDMWEASERLTITGGLRWDPYSQRITNNIKQTSNTTKDEPFHYRLGARYQMSDVFALHANWGESFVLNSGTGRDGAGFAPESGHGYELGVTAALPGIDVAVTWFDIAKRDILTNDPVDPNFLAPVGSLSSKGVEFDASAKLNQDWQIIANYAWTRSRADDSAFASDAVLNVPEHSGAFFVLGNFKRGADHGLSLSAGLRYVGDRPGALDGSGFILPHYVTAKAAVEYALSRRVTLRLEADNIFDERYADSSYSQLWVFPGTPRSVKGSLRLSL